MSTRSAISTLKLGGRFLKFAPLLAAGLLSGLGTPAAAQAQTQDNRARIDDFSIRSQSRTSAVQIDQLGSSDRDVTTLSGPLAKPNISAPNLAPQAGTGSTGSITQISQNNSDSGIGEQSQLSSSAQSRDIADASISSTQASRPTAVERLSGTDRCEPGESAAQSDQCANILENRAEQFAATEAPSESVEQSLLANNSKDGAAIDTLATRLNLASRDTPNASLSSNQEIASLYLDPAQANTLGLDLPDNTGAAIEAVLKVIQSGNGLPPSISP